MAVIHPIKSRMTKSRPELIICVIWIAATVLASPQLFVSRTRERIYGGDILVECGERWNNRSRSIYTVTILTVTYIVPLLLLIFSYHSICYALWRTFEYTNGDLAHNGVRDQLRLQSRRKVCIFCMSPVLKTKKRHLHQNRCFEAHVKQLLS